MSSLGHNAGTSIYTPMAKMNFGGIPGTLGRSSHWILFPAQLRRFGFYYLREGLFPARTH